MDNDKNHATAYFLLAFICLLWMLSAILEKIPKNGDEVKTINGRDSIWIPNQFAE